MLQSWQLDGAASSSTLFYPELHRDPTLTASACESADPITPLALVNNKSFMEMLPCSVQMLTRPFPVWVNEEDRQTSTHTRTKTGFSLLCNLNPVTLLLLSQLLRWISVIYDACGEVENKLCWEIMPSFSILPSMLWSSFQHLGTTEQTTHIKVIYEGNLGVSFVNAQGFKTQCPTSPRGEL